MPRRESEHFCKHVWAVSSDTHNFFWVSVSVLVCPIAGLLLDITNDLIQTNQYWLGTHLNVYEEASSS